MTWIKLEEKAPRHPKIVGLSDRAFRVWVTALCYASEFLTDGILPPVYLLTVKASITAELIAARLWEVTDGATRIHDYLGHQSSRSDVDHSKQRNRQKAKAWRDRNKDTVTGNGVTGSNRSLTEPENREQRTDTENREQTTPSASRGGGLILSPKDYARLQETHAFIGSVLRVPKVLHFELRSKSGADADTKLLAWYGRLNEELELSGKGTGDVFQWLRPRHQAFAVEQGWIDAPPKPQAVVNRMRPVAELLAEDEARKAGKAS